MYDNIPSRVKEIITTTNEGTMIEEKTLKNSYKPYDFVSHFSGAVGFIQEVSVNACQDEPEHQTEYAIVWLINDKNLHTAWHKHSDLTLHANLFIEIAKASCHPMGNSERYVKQLFNNFDVKN